MEQEIIVLIGKNLDPCNNFIDLYSKDADTDTIRKANLIIITNSKKNKFRIAKHRYEPIENNEIYLISELYNVLDIFITNRSYNNSSPVKIGNLVDKLKPFLSQSQIDELLLKLL